MQGCALARTNAPARPAFVHSSHQGLCSLLVIDVIVSDTVSQRADPTTDGSEPAQSGLCAALYVAVL